jgi:hypothetical protein
MGEPELALARAILVGVIERDSLPPEVLEHISPLVPFITPNAETRD